jgi:predicted RND superfamily exporter protein
MPHLTASLREQLSVSEPVSIEDMPSELRNEWISSDGQVRLRVLPTGNLETADQMKEFTELVQTVAPNPAGAPASISGAGQAILHSFIEAIAYTVVAIAVMVTIVRRRLTDVLLVLAPLAVASLWTVAGSAVLDLPFNFANVIVIPLLIGLGVASSIHIVGRAREAAHEATLQSQNADVLDTSTPLAVLITQLNTVAAFSTLALAEHQGLFSMGILLGLAIFFTLTVSLVVLPSFMIAIGMSKGAPSPASEAASS